MRRFAIIAIILTLGAGASTVLAAPVNEPVVRIDKSLVLATSSPGNAYVLGGTVVAVAPVAGDLTAVGGTVDDAAAVAGDALLLGGSVGLRAPVAGDARVVAGSVHVEKPIGGDFAAIALSVSDTAPVAGSVEAVALTTSLTGGVGGPVNVYGNTVTLGGDFAGDVHVVAGDKLTLLPGTHIRGTLSYEAPVPAAIPDSATVGEVSFTAASYLPGAGVSKSLAMASIGIFLFARVLASLILAGLLAGLFPSLAEAVVDEAYVRSRRSRHILLTTLLGFAAAVATPILILLLALTLVGLGLAILLGLAYALLALLALVYAGICVGAVFARRFLHRDHIRWTDGMLGTLGLSLFALIPILGPSLVLLLACFSAGALLQICFRFAFRSEEETASLL